MAKKTAFTNGERIRFYNEVVKRIFERAKYKFKNPLEIHENYSVLEPCVSCSIVEVITTYSKFLFWYKKNVEYRKIFYITTYLGDDNGTLINCWLEDRILLGVVVHEVTKYIRTTFENIDMVICYWCGFNEVDFVWAIQWPSYGLLEWGE